MQKLLSWIGLTAGGWMGWTLGQPVSLMTALMLSFVGTGLGLYVGRRMARDYF